MRFISCASYYGSGSSAITDLIGEYENVFSFTDEEFRFIHDMDGIDDLEFHLVENQNRHNSGHSLKRYKRLVDFYSGGLYGKKYEKFFEGNWKKISYEYIEALTDLSYKGWWLYDMYDKGMGFYYRKRIPSKILKKTIWRKQPERTLNNMKNEITYCSAPSEERFISLTRDYIEKLFSSVCPQNKIVMVDQIVPPSNLWRYTRYFKDIQVVVVDRDPRDIWTLEKYVWKDGAIPYEDVESFCKWFKYTRKHRESEKYDGRSARLIQFEDLIFHYDRVIGELEDWLRIKSNEHIYQGKGFDPKKSIENTKTWLKYNVEKSDIEYIESELKDYLYDFPQKADWK